MGSENWKYREYPVRLLSCLGTGVGKPTQRDKRRLLAVRHLVGGERMRSVISLGRCQRVDLLFDIVSRVTENARKTRANCI